MILSLFLNRIFDVCRQTRLKLLTYLFGLSIVLTAERYLKLAYKMENSF